VRYAVFSDVHGNLQALQSVARRIRDLNVDRCICLGDIVGYGGNPNECVAEVRDLADGGVAGNHDHAVLGTTDITYFNYNARNAVLWGREVLTEENRRYLEEIPLVLREGSILFVHSSPRNPEEWHYVLSSDAADEAFEHFEEDVCLIGHSHRPLLAAKQDGRPCSVEVPGRTRLEKGFRYILNEGSVGQPRDEDPRACFLLLDTDQRTAAIERVEYDIGAAQRAILDAGLPAALAERLEHGW